MKFQRIIKLALKNIKSNKLRSALTMLGLIIGIVSVIVLVGIGSGASQSVTSKVKSLGTNVLTVSITSTDTSLDYSDMNEMLKLNNVAAVAPYKNVSATVSRGTTTSSKTSIIATNDSYLDITNTTLSKGRNISSVDIENQSKVCILGSDTATTLFSLADPIGEKIKLNGDNYTVIGVLTSQGTSMGNNVDSMIIMPLTTAKYLGTDTTINRLYVKASDENNINEAETTIENYIRDKLQISSDYYSVSSQSSMLSAMGDISSTLSLLLGGIASISLIVGGIGVMNVMLISVTERTTEIGIRKALGAKKSDILVQFLTEALVLSLLGGIIGIALGLGIGNVLSNFNFTFKIGIGVILLAFGSSAFIGIIFGIFPAYRAACLKPIDALRTD